MRGEGVQDSWLIFFKRKVIQSLGTNPAFAHENQEFQHKARFAN